MCWARTPASRSTSSPTFSPTAVRRRRARAREGRHPAGDRRGRGYARRSRVRSVQRRRLAGPGDRPADPRHARDASAPSTAARSTAYLRRHYQRRRDRGRRGRRGRSRRIVDAAPRRFERPRRGEAPAGLAGALSRRRDPDQEARSSRPISSSASRARGPRADARRGACVRRGGGGGMSSRLFQEVREKRGLAYSIYAFHWAYSDAGLFGFYAGDVAEGRRRTDGGGARLSRRGGAAARARRRSSAPRRR